MTTFPADTDRSIESQLIDDLFKIIDPHLADEHHAASRTDRLFHFLRPLLIQLDADRRRSLDDVKQLPER